MNFFIQSPSKAVTAEVNKSHQLCVHSATVPELAHRSRTSADSFEFHPPRMSVPYNVDMMLVRLENISNDKLFCIHRVRYYYNGGDTAPYSSSCIVRMYIGTAASDGDATTGQFGAADVPHNLNIASRKKPEVAFSFWDGVSNARNGMSIGGVAYTNDQKGDQINCGFFAQGHSSIEFDGSLILSPGNVLGLSAEVEQDNAGGQVILVINGYFIGVDEV